MMSSDIYNYQPIRLGSQQRATRYFPMWTLYALFSNPFQTQSGNETSSIEAVHTCLMNAPGFQLSLLQVVCARIYPVTVCMCLLLLVLSHTCQYCTPCVYTGLFHDHRSHWPSSWSPEAAWQHNVNQDVYLLYVTSVVLLNVMMSFVDTRLEDYRGLWDGPEWMHNMESLEAHDLHVMRLLLLVTTRLLLYLANENTVMRSQVLTDTWFLPQMRGAVELPEARWKQAEHATKNPELCLLYLFLVLHPQWILCCSLTAHSCFSSLSFLLAPDLKTQYWGWTDLRSLDWDTTYLNLLLCHVDVKLDVPCEAIQLTLKL